ncbi:MAG: site-specific integrase, partial [Cytophagaceae bacterium]|nr:site-specific integrase [Cytophagaceae bacterium]
MVTFTYQLVLLKSRSDKEGKAPLTLFVNYSGNRTKFPINGIKVKPELWDKNRYRIASKNSLDLEIEIINNKIIEIEKGLSDYQKELLFAQNSFDINRIKEILQGSVPSKKNNFFDHYQEYLDLNAPPIKAERTIKSFRTTLNKIKDFEVKYQYKITYASLNISFFEKFRKYILIDNQYEYNYFSKIIANIKTFLSWAFEKGYHNRLDYKKFKATEKETSIITLTKDELLLLLDYPFESDRLAKVRDVFCFSCFTGLRVSDLMTLKRSHIQNGFIIKDIVKTKEKCRIPISPYTEAILEKYNKLAFSPLPIISSQKYNQYIKECCQIAGINETVYIDSYKSGVKTSLPYPKYELITSHVGRKTFTTLSLILGMSETAVKQITGHKKES